MWKYKTNLYSTTSVSNTLIQGVFPLSSGFVKIDLNIFYLYEYFEAYSIQTYNKEKEISQILLQIYWLIYSL